MGWMGIRAAVTAPAVLAMAMGCSSSPTGDRLPTSAEGQIGIVRSTCALDGSGNQASANGRFATPVEYSADATPPAGEGEWRLRLYVRDASSHVVGFASKSIALGSTSWTLSAKVPIGEKATQCELTIFQSVY